MSKVDDAIAEIDAALADIAPKHEGLRDFASLDIRPETMESVQGAIQLYNRRVHLLETAGAALRELQADGHPPLTIPDVTLSVYEDLQENKRTIDAALAQFATNAATSLGLEGASPTPKTNTKAPKAAPTE